MIPTADNHLHEYVYSPSLSGLSVHFEGRYTDPEEVLKYTGV